MRYEIKGGSFPIVVCQLESGEQMITEKGSMVWMTPNMQMDILFHGRFRRGGRICIIGVAGCCGLCGTRAAAADKQGKEQECCQQEGYLFFHFIHLFSNRMWADLSSDKTRTYRKKFPKCCSHRTQ